MANGVKPCCKRCGHLSYEDFVAEGLDWCDCDPIPTDAPTDAE